MKEAKRILIVADTLDVNASSGAKGRIALINSLRHCGYHLKVLHYSRKDIHIDEVNCIAISEKKNSLHYFLSKCQIVLNRITGINLNPSIERRRGFSYAHSYDVASIKQAIKEEAITDYDWIFAMSYAGSFRAHKAVTELPEWHSKFLAYVHDPYPQASYPRPYDWVEPGHQQKREFFLAVSAAAKHIIYPSKYLGEWMESYYQGARGKTVTIPHQLPHAVVGEPTLDFFYKEGFTILHAGSLMSARNPIPLAEAFSELCQEHADFQKDSQLLFIGNTDVFDEGLQLLSQKLLKKDMSPYKNLHLHSGSLPFNEVLPLQYAAQVNVILEAKGPFSPFLPGKVAHCIKANKPMLLLGPYKSETRRVLGEAYPYWSEIDDVPVIKAHLKTLYNAWKSNHKQDLEVSKEVGEYFSADYVKTQFDHLI